MDQWEECARWAEIYQTRTYDLKHRHRVSIDLRTQWQRDADLVDIERTTRVNLDFDFKRRLVGVTEREGVLAAQTEPWPTVDEFHEFRDAFEAWKKTFKRVLKTREDLCDFLRWRSEKSARRAAGTNARTNLPPVATAFIRAWSRQQLGLPGGNYRQVAEQMTEAGWRATADTFKSAKRRGDVPVGQISSLTPDDESFISWALTRWPQWEVEALARPGSQAATRIGELRCRCQTSYPCIGRMTPEERSNCAAPQSSTQPLENGGENKVGVILSEKHDSDPPQEQL